MNRETLTKAILEATIDRAMDDLEKDPNRSIRNLVDLALNFSSGRFQKHFFTAAQKMLKDESSAYYELVRHTMTNISREALKRFGMNLGYNSCTSGARKIRENEEAFGFNIPWTILFDRNAENGSVSREEIASGIRQGRELGIYTYLVHCESGFGTEELAVFREFPDCAFFLLIMPGELSGEAADGLCALPNVVTVLNTAGEGLYEAAMRLKERRLLYGVCLIYGEREREEIVSGRWCEAILALEPTAGFLLKREDCSRETAQEIDRYIHGKRAEQIWPVFLLDVWSDILEIDQIISEDACSVEFASDGRLLSAAGEIPGEYSLKDMTLREILERTMPKKNRPENGRQGD